MVLSTQLLCQEGGGADELSAFLLKQIFDPMLWIQYSTTNLHARNLIVYRYAQLIDMKSNIYCFYSAFFLKHLRRFESV